MRKLKTLLINLVGLRDIKMPFLENLYILQRRDNDMDINYEKEALENILDMNNLKSLYCFEYLKKEHLRKTNKINLSVTRITCCFEKDILNSFLEKFPNVEDCECSGSKIENVFCQIKENENCKINKVGLATNLNGILYCHSFESLISLNISIFDKATNVENIIPLFNDNCKAIFKSLTSIILNLKDINERILNNLKKNISHVKYMYYFSLSLTKKNISKSFYYDFIREILSKQINSVMVTIVDINQRYLNKEEIKKIIPNFNSLNFLQVMISEY